MRKAQSTIETADWVLAQPGFEILQEGHMNIQAKMTQHLPLLAGGFAAILVSGIAIASLALSAQGSNDAVAPPETPAAAVAAADAAPASRSYRCADCGVIESTREIDAPDANGETEAPGRIAAGNGSAAGAKLRRTYEITVRLQDGTMRVIRDAKPAKWRHGEPVTIIAGAE